MSSIRIAGTAEVVPFSDGRLTLHIPIQIRHRDGCKKITLQNGEIGMPQKPSRPTAMQLALARGHRWLAMLESGEVKTLRELAVHEGVDNSYVSRMINLTMLSPYVVAAILNETLPDETILFELAVNPPLVWGVNPPHLSSKITLTVSD